jgi:hypothetical protein
MSSLRDTGLTPIELNTVEEALATDAALREELEMITSFLAERPRRTFWRAFAAGCAAGGRPAAAVLEALEQAHAARG